MGCAMSLSHTHDDGRRRPARRGAATSCLSRGARRPISPLDDTSPSTARATRRDRDVARFDAGAGDQPGWTVGDVQRTLGIGPAEWAREITRGTIRLRRDGLVDPESLRRVLMGTAL